MDEGTIFDPMRAKIGMTHAIRAMQDSGLTILEVFKAAEWIASAAQLCITNAANESGMTEIAARFAGNDEGTN